MGQPVRSGWRPPLQWDVDSQSRVAQKTAASSGRGLRGPAWRVLPPEGRADLRRLFALRALRALGDGYVALLLPAYLVALGFSPLQVGAITAATLLGSGAMVLALGLRAHRHSPRRLVRVAAALMTVCGFAFALCSDFWPLLLVAAVSTLNPAAGDVSVFVPLEQSMIAQRVRARHRTAVFARYSLIGGIAGSVGALAAALPEALESVAGVEALLALKLMFALHGLFGLVAFVGYHGLSVRVEPAGRAPSAPLRESRPLVLRMSAVFALDQFGSGFAVQSMVALWLYARFDLSASTVGQVFFVAGLLASGSYLVSSWVARRIGLVNTMVWTHLPANVFLVAAAFMPDATSAIALLLLRYSLSSMDVPVRSSWVMAVVPAHERAAAASITAIPRSLATGVSPFIAGWMLGLSSFGWPLVVGGVLKIGYDLLMLRMFGSVRPPEEQRGRGAREAAR